MLSRHRLLRARPLNRGWQKNGETNSLKEKEKKREREREGKGGKSPRGKQRKHEDEGKHLDTVRDGRE